MYINTKKYTHIYIFYSSFLYLYKALIRPAVEYCACVWHPILKRDRISIENIQRRATERVSGLSNYPYHTRLRKLGLPTLEYRRERSDMIQVYKILNSMEKVDIPTLRLNNNTHTRGHSKKLLKQQVRLNTRKFSFSCRVVETWNSLTEEVVSAPSVNSFKSRLNILWHNHPRKFVASCYEPEVTTRKVNEIVMYIRQAPGLQ